MPSYTVLQRGFYDNKLYDPEGKRRQLSTDSPIDPLPSWLEPIKETAKDAKNRKERDRKATIAAKKSKDKDTEEIQGASFMDEPAVKGANVETL